jgi:hypothetical protein
LEIQLISLQFQRVFSQQNLAFVADFEGFLREDFAAGIGVTANGDDVCKGFKLKSVGFNPNQFTNPVGSN